MDMNNHDPFATVDASIKEKLQGVPDVVPPTLPESLLAAIEKQYGPLPPEPRMTPARIRATCRFCHGKGCLNCDTLIQQEYTRQFPDGPQPLLTFNVTDPEDIQLARDTLGGETLQAMAETRDLDAAIHMLFRKIDQAVEVQKRLAEAPREDIP